MSTHKNTTPPLKIDLPTAKETHLNNQQSTTTPPPTFQGPIILSPGPSSLSSTNKIGGGPGDVLIPPTLSRNKSNTSRIANNRKDSTSSTIPSSSSSKSVIGLGAPSKISPKHSPRLSPRPTTQTNSNQLNQSNIPITNSDQPADEEGSYFALNRPGNSSSSGARIYSPKLDLDGQSAQHPHRASVPSRKHEPTITSIAPALSRLSPGSGGGLHSPPQTPIQSVLPHLEFPSSNQRPHSPVRALSNSYAPARIPPTQNVAGTGTGNNPGGGSGKGAGHSPSSSIHFEDGVGVDVGVGSGPGAVAGPSLSSQQTGQQSTLAAPTKRRDPHAQYLAQEKVYLQKIRNDIMDDYYMKGLSPVGENESESDDDEDSVSEIQTEVIGFGGVGTSFDDEYTDMGSAYPLLEAASAGYHSSASNNSASKYTGTITANSVYANNTPTSVSSSSSGSNTIPLTTTTSTTNGAAYRSHHHSQSEDNNLIQGVTTTTTTGTTGSGIESPLFEDPEQWRERLEWQAMLASVLTGEVFRSEKRRIKAPNRRGNNFIDEEELWLGIRAKVSGRTLVEQKRVLDYSRSTVTDALERVLNFRIENPTNITAEEACRQLTPILHLLDRCESLWRSRVALRNENTLYASPAFQARADALISWSSITDAINQELQLLRDWTGNSDIDPSRAPEKPETVSDGDENSNNNIFNNMVEDKITLVESILKQDDLHAIFENRISARLGPLIEKARAATIDYSDVFISLGLPLFHKGLLHLMIFPITLVREIIQMRLTYARRLVNPTMMIIDQMITDFHTYIKHALLVMERNLSYTAPILDKGWIFPTQIDESFNSTILDCVNFYLDLLNKKFLDGGRSSKSLFRAYKETEQLEQHYAFLLEVGRLIEGGDITVAEQITSLESRILTRLLSYWEHQMKGPPTWAPAEIERWFPTTMEIIRSFQRKLMRFHK